MKPSIGRIVHYVYADFDGVRSDKIGAHRPAIVTRVWGDTCVNLQVFTDGENDRDQGAERPMFKSSVCFDAEGKPGSCHWPERED